MMSAMSSPLLILLYLLALPPVLAYPAALIAGAMAFDAPGSTTKWQAWLVFILSVSYPLFIFGCIALSVRFQSVTLALLATIPTAFLVHTLWLAGFLKARTEFYSRSRDFIYDDRRFLHVGAEQDQSAPVFLFERVSLFSYAKHEIASIYNDKHIQAEAFNPERIRTLTDKVLRNAVNADGCSLFERYREVPSDMPLPEIYRLTETLPD